MKWVSSHAVTFQVRCPAKLNLFLSVGPPDSSGYHPLRTVFQAVGLFDDMRITTGGERTEVVSNWPGLPERNTLTRTVSLLQELTDLPPLRIELVKRIPAKSGMGGGSSDAAGLLRALPKLGVPALPGSALLDVASAVGSDVPFFLFGGRAKGEGYGERITPLPDANEWYVIAQPQAECATAEMYARLDELTYEWKPFSEPMALYNDFERVAPRECLDLIKVLRESEAQAAGLTGSGSAVFAITDSALMARRIQIYLRSTFDGPIWIAPGLTRPESVAIE